MRGRLGMGKKAVRSLDYNVVGLSGEGIGDEERCVVSHTQ